MFPMGQAAAAAAASGSLDWQTVNLGDGSWTAATDPDSLVSAASTSSGLTTITYNVLSVGSNDYTFGSNVTNLEPWRRHKLLSIGGATLTGADSFLVALEIDNSSGYLNSGATQTFIGIATNPTSTTRATVEALGLVEQHIATNPPDYASATPGGIGTILGNAANTIGRVFFAVHGGVVTSVECVATGGGSTYGPQGPQGRDSGVSGLPGSDQISIVIAAGTRGSATIAANDQASGTFRYAVTKLGT
jgi:hypothetical protein